MAYRLATQLNSAYVPHGDQPDSASALQNIAQVEGITAVELSYPEHFKGESQDLLMAAHDLGLAVTALNVSFEDPVFFVGAFTHPSGEVRSRAIRKCIEAAEFAANRGIDHVILRMGADGFDHPFQADYRQLWQLELDGFRAICDATPTIRISVEYTPSQPRRHTVTRNMGETLLMLADVDRRNLGVTLNYGNSLLVNENPATAASMAMQRSKLFGVRFNDGYGIPNDRLMVGSVSFWQSIELLWTLRQGGYRGTLYFEACSNRLDATAEFIANSAMIQRLESLLDAIPAAQLGEAQVRQDGAGAWQIVQDAILKN